MKCRPKPASNICWLSVMREEREKVEKVEKVVNPRDHILRAIDGNVGRKENTLAMCARVKEIFEEATPEQISQWWSGLRFDFKNGTAIVTFVFPSQPPQSPPQ